MKNRPSRVQDHLLRLLEDLQVVGLNQKRSFQPRPVQLKKRLPMFRSSKGTMVSSDNTEDFGT